MPISKSPLRRRVTLPVDFNLPIEDSTGSSILPLKLSFDLNAFALIEEVTGISMLTELDKVFEKPSVTVISAMLWATVQEYHPEYEGITGLRAIRNLVTLATIKLVTDACLKAFISQLPREQAEILNKRIAGEEVDVRPLAQPESK